MVQSKFYIHISNPDFTCNDICKLQILNSLKYLKVQKITLKLRRKEKNSQEIQMSSSLFKKSLYAPIYATT